ncbi:Oidioi.mRNA.OKI2018_I69.chr2.g7447.t1.cds [Oikopleura dioica]|uniref:Beta-hexosaminidase n=1 Tax=Oikopleura dioica TaxID=34765 RepID=A0ABN7TF73_OIKDI|nr:Oidioi.mRNA.OKI2018_I69.chr2.g7447.t1.cds [Oikopleura dioica]
MKFLSAFFLGNALTNAADRFLPPWQYDGTVWPLPQSMAVTQEFQILDANIQFVLTPESPQCDIIPDIFQRYQDLIRSHFKIASSSSKKLKFSASSAAGIIDTIEVKIINCENYPSQNMNESYTLQVGSPTPEKVELTASAEWGVIHGLESFTQMIHNIDYRPSVNSTMITDWPRFPFRGFLIDTSRHYLPISVIKAQITALSWNKMNILHWHIVDLQSFPYESQVLPELSFLGSYTPLHVYTIHEIKDIIEFARLRGVRVVPEFDTPGHTDAWGPGGGPKFLTPCYRNGEPDGSHGPINPIYQENYDLMRKLFTEVNEVFRDSYLHLGGDEVPFGCWKSNPDITAYMAKNNLTTYAQLEQVWVQGMVDIAHDLKKNYVVWEEVFVNGVKISNETVVEVWKGRSGTWKDTMNAVTKSGHKAILASPWYLNIISYGVDWEGYYVIEPTDFNGTAEQNKLVMGGSAAMWGEFVDGTNILQRIWPRASAVAERLWSDKSVNQPGPARWRLNEWRCKMLARGLPAQPAIQNPNVNPNFGYCPYPFDPFNNAHYLF